MKLQFDKTVCPCLRRVTSQHQSQEQTQEVKLPDSMPDIGRVLGCWGQVLVRGKEWYTGGMGVSGGVMAWVLYAPEDGSAPRSMDTWIPFQMKWDFPETQRDGTILVDAGLKSMDCRSTSARKLMLRAVVSILGEALEPAEAELYRPEAVPEDIQLLRGIYPMEVPQEAGEKQVTLDEELLPESLPAMGGIVRYSMEPEITEQKVLAGRLVFRGSCKVHILHTDEEGNLHTWDTELPFSQYADLDRDYGVHAAVEIVPAVTGMEMEKDEQGRLRLKCAVTAQYVLYDRVMVELVEDAYSPYRKVQLQGHELSLPARLDVRQEQLPLDHVIHAQAQDAVDVAAYWQQPNVRQNGDETVIDFPVQYQLLYRDDNGSLQGVSAKAEESMTLPCHRKNQLAVRMKAAVQPVATGVEDVRISGNIAAAITTFAQQGLPMVTALEFDEQKCQDAARPSVILRRMGQSRLWDIAKECGSTVDVICKANGISEEPQGDAVLLIPVL